MRVAHFDCFSGISGDMALAALLDGGVPFEPVRDAILSLGLPITIDAEDVRKGGFAATEIFIEVPEEDTHRFLPEIEEILGRGKLTDKQRELALKIFRRLADAEAEAHGLAVDEIHFHEVGALDSIADIVGAAVALDLLGVDKFTSSSVVTGSGTVKCAHGVMPIPTPGTAALLKGVPLRPSNIKSELTTPTGAAILTSVVSEWTDAPAMTIETVGHGAGKRELDEQPNLLRILVGTSTSPTNPQRELGNFETDHVWVLETNLDDVPGEVIGHCFDLLFAAGALDVFTMPITMKKNRPGVLLSVLASGAAISAIEAIVFRETGTLGIRRYQAQRHKLKREAVTVQTSWGPVQGKVAWLEGKPSFSPEFDDCARIAREHNVALSEISNQAIQAYKQSSSS
jgi:uncharacterized protein (TIGR00299 family) protein